MTETQTVVNPSTTREKFVARFGEEQADAIERAAELHKNGIHDRKGSDPFRWAIAIVIGYQCVEKYGTTGEHGITVPWNDFRDWVKSDGDLANHDGDVDYLSVFAGVYNEYIGMGSAEASA